MILIRQAKLAVGEWYHTASARALLAAPFHGANKKRGFLLRIGITTLWDLYLMSFACHPCLTHLDGANFAAKRI